MTDEVLPTVTVLLTWEREKAGETAILRRDAGASRWDEVGRTAGTEWTVAGLHPERSYDVAAAPVLGDGGLAAENAWEVLRVAPAADVGRPARPVAPTGFAAAQDGPNVNLRWDAPTDGVTATYELRVGDSWEDGVRIADRLSPAPYAWAWWASGEFTLHVKAIDRQGRASLAAASVTLAIEPLGTHVTDVAIDIDGAGFPATKEGTEVAGGALRLAALPACFGAATEPFGSFVGVPCFARFQPVGTYETAAINVGQIESHRVELDLGAAQPIDAVIPFGAVRRPALGARRRRDGTAVPLGTRGFASRNSWRMTPLVPVDVLVEVDTSQTPEADWEGWRPYVPGTYTYWRLRLRLSLRGDGLRYVSVGRLRLRTRKLNLKDEGQVVTGGIVPEAVTFAAPFSDAPQVVAQIIDSGVAVRVAVSSVTKTGCEVEAFDAAGDPLAATVSWHALGV